MAYTEDTVGETLAHLCQEPLVSLVTVGHLGIPHWNSQNGARPAGIPARDLTKGGYTIYTPVQFSAMTTLVDHRSAPTREFDLPGGAVGQDDIRDLDAPVLLPNHRYILVFVPGLDPGSSTNDPTWFTVYWTYRVVGTSIVTQEQGIQQGKVAQPEQREPLAQLEAFLAAGCR